MKRDPDLYLDVPSDFDDSDAEAQVHAVACRLFPSRTNAGAFAAAQEWVSAHDIRIIDTSWTHFDGESEPLCLALYFTFEPDFGPDEDPYGE
jgi:hypothetical protein